MNRQRIDVRMKLDLGRDLAYQKTAACTDWLSARLLRRVEREEGASLPIVDYVELNHEWFQLG